MIEWVYHPLRNLMGIYCSARVRNIILMVTDDYRQDFQGFKPHSSKKWTGKICRETKNAYQGFSHTTIKEIHDIDSPAEGRELLLKLFKEWLTENITENIMALKEIE